MSQLSEYERESLKKLGESIHERKWSNDGLVQLIELVGTFLNLKSIQQYANDKGKTYNGIKKAKKARIILGHRFITDNE